MAIAQDHWESPCYYCATRECEACIHAKGGPTVEEVRFALAMLADARKVAATFNDYGMRCGVVAVHRNARDLPC